MGSAINLEVPTLLKAFKIVQTVRLVPGFSIVDISTLFAFKKLLGHPLAHVHSSCTCPAQDSHYD